MAGYKPLNITSLPRIEEKLTEDAVFWKTSLEPAKIVNEYGAINCLDLNEAKNELLVTSMTKITLYNHKSMTPIRAFNSLTPYSVYGAVFRKNDYKLIISGTEEGKLNLHDVKTAKPLKVLSDNPKTKHLGPVHGCQFFCNHQIVSTSDDKTIKLWDLASGALIKDIGSHDTSKPHGDYVRTCCVDNELQTVVSGSYDHTVKVWDVREAETNPVRCINLPNPVECVIPHGNYIIAACSRNVYVIDTIAGTIYKSFENIHSKTVTSLSSYNKFLISGSLDGNLKIFDKCFNYVSSVSYSPANVLSVAIDSKCVAIGANDGSVFTRQFKTPDNEAAKLVNGSANGKKRYYDWVKEENELEAKKLEEEDKEALVICQRYFNDKVSKKKLKSYDRRMRKFDASNSLDEVLKYEKPAVVVSLMHELIRRGQLSSALAGRSGKSLNLVADFLIDYVRDPKYNRILIDVASVFIDVYERKISQSPEVQHIFADLNDKLRKEVELTKCMKQTEGALSMILANINRPNGSLQ